MLPDVTRANSGGIRWFYIPSLLLASALVGATLASLDVPEIVSSSLSTAASCNIKGNVSINTGERIYHVPGQEYYNATVISRQHGERWFCSEQEARQAGWRKARN